ncbi:DUF3060 domain-containing protein [Actinomyces howellii]|uniref:DUF3060 domain-containing protein n=1 Tax=Actinomyces howellii TaxID=52771 RepID=A0A448HDE2_9ACTO|nr:DUF3060 domain-containing protein [Actinomyces howellii]VEG25751.1 Uncharacterised protein [Actinomyces howellii]
MRPTPRAAATVCALLLPLTLTACSDPIALVPSATSAATAQQTSAPSQEPAQEAEESTGDTEDTVDTEDLEAEAQADGATNVETGPCSPMDLSQETSAEDIDVYTSREVALSKVEQVVPASDEVVLDDSAWNETPVFVVRVEAGARSVRVEATGMTVIVDGDIESLTVNGVDNTVWVSTVGTISFGDVAAENEVFWNGQVPSVGTGGADWENYVARDEYAVYVQYYCY